VRERNIAGLQQLVSHHSAPSSRGNAAFKVNARQADMRTVLHYSVEEGCIELTAAVAQLPGIDLHARDGNGRTPLHLAAMHAHESPDRLQCLFLLAELGGSELGSIADNDGSTALHLAADKGTPQAVSVLVNHGIKVDCADHDGMTPLQISARRGYLDVVETLLKNKATVSHVDFDGATALSYASAQGHVEIVKALLAAGSDPNACDLCSASPLKVAIERGHLQVASALVHGEQAVDLRNCDLHSCEWLASLCSNANAAVTLNASGNKMDDAGAVCVLTAVVVSMPQLVVLDLSDNQISNDALQHLPTEVLAGMGRLSSLSLAHNQIRMLHPNVAALHGLVNLDLSGNGLSDLPLEIARCAVLQRVNLSCNQLATLGAGLCQLTRLVVLDVSSNQLQSLPSGLLTLHNLQMLEASNNLLAALPALPTSLLSLHLDHNRLVEIPPQVGGLGLGAWGLGLGVSHAASLTTRPVLSSPVHMHLVRRWATREGWKLCTWPTTTCRTCRPPLRARLFASRVDSTSTGIHSRAFLQTFTTRPMRSSGSLKTLVRASNR
jgi:ankyrin repeat protein